MIDLILTGICYFFFNRAYFHFILSVIKNERMNHAAELIFFFINYSFFIFCTLCQFQLVYNWMAFGFLLFAETLFYVKKKWLQSAYFAMNGVICGLTINIICRCLFAVFLNVPLTAFNHNVLAIGNIKGYPIMLGFIISACILMHFSHYKRSDMLHFVFNYKKQFQFLCAVMILIMLCLLLHLLLYNYDENTEILKVWGIWSCTFVFYAYYLALNYSIRICQNLALDEQNLKLKEILNMQIIEEAVLSDEVFRDELTGLYNRSYARGVLNEMLAKRQPFCLCFVDLDGLKAVNDTLGHSIGDKYILEISRLLLQLINDEHYVYRIGGDEFLLISTTMTVSEAEVRLADINARLGRRQKKYSMSISYGVVYSNNQWNIEELITAADEQMYLHKKMKNF